MITIKNVKTLDGRVTDYTVSSQKEEIIDAHNKLLLLPALIDSHAYLGDPDQKIWEASLNSVIRGGITTIFEVPHPPFLSNSKESLEKKKQSIDKQLQRLGIPLHYYFYAGVNQEHLEELGPVKNLSMGIVLNLDTNQPKASLDDKFWDRIFQIAAWEDLPIVINANNENTKEGFNFHGETLLEKAIVYTEKHSGRLFVLNVSNQHEMNLIKTAREQTLLIYAETTPQHLFQEDEVLANFLWKAVKNKDITVIGSGFNADFPNNQRLIVQGGNFSSLDPQFLLPRLLNAYHEGKISLERIVETTRFNLNELFKIEKNSDVVLVDLEEERTVKMASGSKLVEQKLKGWPVYTVLNGHLYTLPKSGYTSL